MMNELLMCQQLSRPNKLSVSIYEFYVLFVY